jgi:tRNA(His) 5'-end guanylyltransferase
MSQLMIDTTEYLVKESGASIGYTQSDEISLVWRWDKVEEHSVFFDGRIQKMTSMLAAMGSTYFSINKHKYLPESHVAKSSLFDCRVWQVPNLTEAANVLLWREQDATRNSVSMAAYDAFSHKALHGLKCDEMREKLLTDKGIRWEDYPTFFKRGTYIKRSITKCKLTEADLKSLPPKHNAHKNPDMEFERNVIGQLEIEPLIKIPNKVEVLFG